MNTAFVLLACLLVGDLAETHGLVGARALIVEGASDTGHADRIDVLGAALRARGLNVLDAEERRGFDDVVDVDTRGDRGVAEAHLLAARAAWRQLDVPLATAEARLTIEEILRLVRPDDDLELLSEALIFAAALGLNENADDGTARSFLRLAAWLEPERLALDPALHPPSRVQAWADARAANAATDTVLVVVRPRAPGVEVVEVVVDGVVVVPENGLLRIARGPHLLTLRAGELDSRSRIIDVEADGLVIDDVVQRRADLADRQRLLATLRIGDRDALAAIVVASNADLVVALDVPRAGRSGHLGLLRGGDIPTVIDADPADPAAFAAAVVAALDRNVPTDPGVVVDPDEEAWRIWLKPALVVAGVIVISTASTVTWQLWPAEPPPPPHRPVVVTCCSQ